MCCWLSCKAAEWEGPCAGHVLLVERHSCRGEDPSAEHVLLAELHSCRGEGPSAVRVLLDELHKCRNDGFIRARIESRRIMYLQHQISILHSIRRLNTAKFNWYIKQDGRLDGRWAGAGGT